MSGQWSGEWGFRVRRQHARAAAAARDRRLETWCRKGVEVDGEEDVVTRGGVWCGRGCIVKVGKSKVK